MVRDGWTGKSEKCGVGFYNQANSAIFWRASKLTTDFPQILANATHIQPKPFFFASHASNMSLRKWLFTAHLFTGGSFCKLCNLHSKFGRKKSIKIKHFWVKEIPPKKLSCRYLYIYKSVKSRGLKKLNTQPKNEWLFKNCNQNVLIKFKKALQIILNC